MSQKAKGGGIDLADQLKIVGRESDLRKEASSIFGGKDYGEAKRAHMALRAGVSRPNAQGDMAMIYAFMKMLDPGSVVRESEYATAQNAGGWYAKAAQLKQQGEQAAKQNPNAPILTPQQREEMRRVADDIFIGASKEFKNREDELENTINLEASRIPIVPKSIYKRRIAKEAFGYAPEIWEGIAGAQGGSATPDYSNLWK
jgi:hypothetical protein